MKELYMRTTGIDMNGELVLRLLVEHSGLTWNGLFEKLGLDWNAHMEVLYCLTNLAEVDLITIDGTSHDANSIRFSLQLAAFGDTEDGDKFKIRASDRWNKVRMALSFRGLSPHYT